MPDWIADLMAGDGRWLVIVLAVAVAGALLFGEWERRH